MAPMPRVPFDPSTDYYQLLGLKPTASSDEILAAYRKLAKAYHPDLHASSALAAARMARVNVAKSVLLDRDARARYDHLCALRRPVARVASVPPHVARPAPRTTYRTTPPSSSPAQPARSGLDRTTGMLLLIVVPLLGALL